MLKHLTFFLNQEIDLFFFVAQPLFPKSNAITFLYLCMCISPWHLLQIPPASSFLLIFELLGLAWEKTKLLGLAFGKASNSVSQRIKSLVNWPCPLEGASRSKMHLFLKIMLTLLLPVKYQPRIFWLPFFVEELHRGFLTPEKKS